MFSESFVNFVDKNVKEYHQRLKRSIFFAEIASYILSEQWGEIEDATCVRNCITKIELLCPRHNYVLAETTTPHHRNSKSSLNQPKQVGSWWDFHRSFWWILAPIWHRLQVHQECLGPPRLREETWRTGVVLTWFLMSDLDETFTDTSDGCSLPSDTISRSIRNVHDHLDSRKRIGGQV